MNSDIEFIRQCLEHQSRCAMASGVRVKAIRALEALDRVSGLAGGEKKTTVVNLKICKDKDVVRIDRKTIFGNPYMMRSEADRGFVIRKFRKYFYDRLDKDPVFRQRIAGLKGKKLGCWCKPKACHGDVIAEYLEKEDSENIRG